MKEMVVKAVTDAFIELKLGDIIERLDRRVSTLADRVAALETRQPTYEDTIHPKDEVYDAHDNIDHVATRLARLRHHLRNNTIGMGGTGNRNRVPDDPYAKIKFTLCYHHNLARTEGGPRARWAQRIFVMGLRISSCAGGLRPDWPCI
jgi:hypothetical protein